MPVKCSHTGFSHGERTIPLGHEYQPLCGGGCSEPDSGGSGSGSRLCQPKSSPFSKTVLYDATRDAVTFEYHPGAQHENADGMSRQCGQCSRPNCPVSSSDSRVMNVDSTTVLLDQPFPSSEMGDSMDADLLPELSRETWVAATLLEELTADLTPVASDLDLIEASRQDATLITIREWVQSGAPLAWSECLGLSPELWCWWLQKGNLSVDMEGRLWRRRAPPGRERQQMISRFHDSLFAGHLGVSRTVYRLQDRVYWPGLRHNVRSYISSCTVCLARKSPCPRRAPMGHVDVGHRWDRVAMDLLDCFSRWTEAFPLPDKTALAVADAFFQHIVCRFDMPSVIHLDQGREFENEVMQELCLLCGAHKTRTTPYHPESDGLVERFNRTYDAGYVCGREPR